MKLERRGGGQREEERSRERERGMGLEGKRDKWKVR